MPRGDGPFHIIKRINDKAYELDMPDTYLGSNSFNISDLTLFSAGFPNSWSNSLQPGEYDEDQVGEAPEAKALGDEHHWMSLFVITFV